MAAKFDRRKLIGFLSRRLPKAYKVFHAAADQDIAAYWTLFNRNVKEARRRINLAALGRALTGGNIGEAERIALGDLNDKLSVSFNRAITTTMENGAMATTRLMPKQVQARISFEKQSQKEFRFNFDLTNPRAVDAARNAALELVARVSEQNKEAIREIVSRGIEEGNPPAAMAREIRETVGLTGMQVRSVKNFQRKLRQRGFSAEDVARRTTNFANKTLRRRAITIARTETINAASQGQQELWLQARDEGLLDEDETRRFPIVTPDDRLDRVICAPMPGMDENKNVKLEEPFTTGLGEKRMHPAYHPGCRCAVGIRMAVEPKPIPSARRPQRPAAPEPIDEPLRFKSNADAEAWGNRQSFQADADQLRSLRQYKDVGYVPINEALRGQRTMTSRFRKAVRDVDRVMENTSITDTVTTYRGMSSTAIRESADELVGTVFDAPAYVSTSLDRKIANKFIGTKKNAVGFEIRVPQGSRGLFMDTAALGKKGELELLLPRKTKLKITGTRVVDGIKWITAEVT